LLEVDVEIVRPGWTIYVIDGEAVGRGRVPLFLLTVYAPTAY